MVKIYRSRKSEVRALDGLDLTVAEGSVLGLLGPNGAGKTTAVRVFTGRVALSLDESLSPQTATEPRCRDIC